MADTCSSCGNNLYGNKVKCPFCGEPISKSGYTSNNNQMNNNNVYKTSNSNSGSNYNSSGSNHSKLPSSADTGGAGWGLLGFCVPLVGIILYFVFKDEKPNTAGASLTGAIIGIVLYVLVNLISVF